MRDYIASTIYLSPKNLGMKFELIWATENLGTNSSKNERFSTEQSVLYLPLIIIFPYYFSNFFNCMHVGGSLGCQTLWIFPLTTKNTVLITQYKMINLKLRFWVSQLDNLVYLVLHSSYLIIDS